MRRKIIHIDEEKCTGCGLCVPDCPEGALKIIDGKARLIGDLFCDGLGACLKNCPERAITVEERDAEPYDERKVMVNIVPQGRNVIAAHLEHLREHRQTAYLREAVDYLKEHGLLREFVQVQANGAGAHNAGQCPGSRSTSLAGGRTSRLTHWPIQLHLISPLAPHYRESELLLAADCVAYTIADFHNDYLDGRTLAIACPKLDQGQEAYLAKLVTLIEEAQVKSIRVMVMQVPCCRGLVRLAVAAVEKSRRRVPVRHTVVAIDGTILQDEEIPLSQDSECLPRIDH